MLWQGCAGWRLGRPLGGAVRGVVPDAFNLAVKRSLLSSPFASACRGGRDGTDLPAPVAEAATVRNMILYLFYHSPQK